MSTITHDPITESEIDTFVLSLNDTESEPPCESTHKHGGVYAPVSKCAQKVTHRAIADCSAWPSFNVCDGHVQNRMSVAAIAHCDGCARLGIECWRYIPI